MLMRARAPARTSATYATAIRMMPTDPRLPSSRSFRSRQLSSRSAAVPQRNRATTSSSSFTSPRRSPSPASPGGLEASSLGRFCAGSADADANISSCSAGGNDHWGPIRRVEAGTRGARRGTLP